MLCEVIAYILSRQRLSAKTFVTGCVFYALQDRLSLWVLCDTSGVGERSGVLSTGSPFGHHPRLRMVCPPLGTVGAGWEISFFSPSPLSTLHGFTLWVGITRGYAWYVPRWGQWIETVVSIITPTKKNSFFVVTLSRRSKLADKQMLVGVTTKYLLSHVVILLSRL